jgi:GDP-4-dehydro-6-deoxy-D-mannose reductase
VAAGDDVVGLSREVGSEPVAAVESVQADLLDAEGTRRAVAAAAPHVVYHLAALPSVTRSWRDPGTTLAENTAATLSLLEAVRTEAPGARVLVTGSGEVYGPPDEIPVDESAPLRPQNPYAVSKASGDLLAGMYAAAYGLAVIRTRAFNQAGPRQSTEYAVATFAQQVAAGKLAGADPVLVVSGNPDTRRDFMDVRDSVRAYRLLAEGAEPGIYNVCAGRAVSARELIAALAETAGVNVRHEVDPERVRAHDIPEIRGSHARLTEATGWEPEIPLERTLADTLAWWERELAAGAA